jgi:hypothetical protein
MPGRRNARRRLWAQRHGLARISMQEVRGNSGSGIRSASELRRARNLLERVLAAISRRVSRGAISPREGACRAGYRTVSVTSS